jgi:hypothetical protein
LVTILIAICYEVLKLVLIFTSFAKMQIFVHAEDTMAFDVESTDSIASIKQSIHSRVPIPASEQRLVYGGRQLSDELTLQDYSIQKNSTLQLLLRLRGGLTVFIDPVSNSEMISDAFPSELVKDADGNEIPGLRVFQSRKMTSGGEEINTGSGFAFGGGEAEALDDSTVLVDAIEFTFRLAPLTMSPKELQSYLMPYVQAIRARWRNEARSKEEIQGMMASANAAATFLLSKVKDCEVFINNEYNMEGALCLREWTETGNKYYYLMHGLTGGRDKCAF